MVPPIETHVHAVEPYTKQELSALSLPYIIYHYSLRAQSKMTKNPLLYLYPDIPKDNAFRRYCNISGIVSCLTFPLRIKLFYLPSTTKNLKELISRW